MSSSTRRFLVLSAFFTVILFSAAPASAQLIGINVKSAPYNATGDGVTDDTAAINAAYAAAKSQQTPLLIPSGLYRFTSTLVWDGPVNVIGAAMGNGFTGATFRKAGNFVGIKISTGQFGVTYTGFKLDSFGGESSNGIEIDTQGVTAWAFRDVHVKNQGGHGIVLRSGNMGTFQNVTSSANGGDGVRVEAFTGVNPADSANACTFASLLVNGNGGHGFNIIAGDSHFVLGVVTQGNGGYGFRTNALTSTINVYSESNGSGAILLDSGSLRNNLTILNASPGQQTSIVDLGRLNNILDLANGLIHIPYGLSPSTPAANNAGTNYSFAGGNAGAGALAKNGGMMSVAGGDAAGTSGDGNGGDVFIYGGNAVGGGRMGFTFLQPYGGQVVIGGQTPSSNGAILDLQPNDGPKALLIPRLTTAERDAIPTPKNGMIIFNTTTGRFNFRRSSIWSEVP